MRALLAFTAVLVSSVTIPVSCGILRDAMWYLDRCQSNDFDVCLERDLMRTIDDIMIQNGTYRLNRYLTITVRGEAADDKSRSEDDLGTRLLDFLNSMQFQYRPEAEIERPSDDVFEGRKKKNKGGKHKMGMLMAGTSMAMTMIGGMMTKVMMSGVMMIAVKALIVAKVALALALVIVFKKLMGGGGGGGGGAATTWSGSGGGWTDGYRRSYGPAEVDQSMSTAAAAMAYRDQIGPYSNNVQSLYSQ